MKHLLFIAALLGLAGCATVEVNTTCTVAGHATASDRYGNISYYTILDCDNGYIKSMGGMRYYVIPEKTRIKYSYTKLK